MIHTNTSRLSSILDFRSQTLQYTNRYYSIINSCLIFTRYHYYCVIYFINLPCTFFSNKVLNEVFTMDYQRLANPSSNLHYQIYTFKRALSLSRSIGPNHNLHLIIELIVCNPNKIPHVITNAITGRLLVTFSFLTAGQLCLPLRPDFTLAKKKKKKKNHLVQPKFSNSAHHYLIIKCY